MGYFYCWGHLLLLAVYYH